MQQEENSTLSPNETNHEDAMELNANASKNNDPHLKWTTEQVPPHVKVLGK